MSRLFSNICIFLAIFFLPPYISALALVIFIFAYDNFVEAVFWAYIVDTLYGGSRFFGLPFAYGLTLFMTLFFLCSFTLKKMLKFYPFAQ